MSDLDRCRSCDAPIRWVRSAVNDKSIPLDVEPAVNGNIVIFETLGGEYARFLRKGQTVEADRARFRSHFATCPQAKSWRHRKGGAA